MKIDLSNRIAVVSGGSGEIGRYICRTLAECGANVAIGAYSNMQKAEALRAELEERYGVKALAVRFDMTDLDSVMKMRDEVKHGLGDPDIVVCDALLSVTWGTVLEQTEAEYARQFDGCVIHAVNMAKAFLPAMMEKKYGRFIAINTECIMNCDPTHSPYVAGKKGMDGVLKVLAREMGPYNITVNEVAPGWTITDKVREEQSERQPEYEVRVALKRRGTDQEIANMVTFMASDLAGFITAAYIPVSGGICMPAT